MSGIIDKLVNEIVSDIKENGATIPAIALEYEITIPQVFALLFNVDDAIIKNEIENAKLKFKGDFAMAKKHRDELIDQVEKIYSDEFQNASISNENEAKEAIDTNHKDEAKDAVVEARGDERGKYENMPCEDALAMILVKIESIQESMNDLANRFHDIEENVGFSKYKSIREYIKIHETVTTENIEKIFGSYAKKVLYKMANDGYVKKIAKGIYKYNGGGK